MAEVIEPPQQDIEALKAELRASIQADPAADPESFRPIINPLLDVRANLSDVMDAQTAERLLRGKYDLCHLVPAFADSESHLEALIKKSEMEKWAKATVRMYGEDFQLNAEMNFAPLFRTYDHLKGFDLGKRLLIGIAQGAHRYLEKHEISSAELYLNVMMRAAQDYGVDNIAFVLNQTIQTYKSDLSRKPKSQESVPSPSDP